MRDLITLMHKHFSYRRKNLKHLYIQQKQEYNYIKILRLANDIIVSLH